MSPIASRAPPAGRWLALPAATCLIASLLLALPARPFGLALPEPVVPVIVAFAWGVIRPSVLAPPLLLTMGLVLDLLWRAPLGLWASSLMGVHAIALAGRRTLIGQGVLATAGWYFAACVAAFAFAALATWLRAGVLADPGAVAEQLAATLVLFPFAWRLIRRYEGFDVRPR